VNDERPPIKIDPYRMVSELLMVRTQALSLVRGIEMTLSDLGMLLPTDGIDSVRTPTETPVLDDGRCRHPHEGRRPAPVMGNPERFYCQSCGEVISDKEV